MIENALDFDQIHDDKKNTTFLKWNDVEKNAISMWLAEMNFKCPKPILDHLASLVNQGILGYPNISDDYYITVTNWFNTCHKLHLKDNNIIPVTGVIPALRAIIEEFSSENDYIIIQPPAYHYFIDSVNESNRKILWNPLIKDQYGYYIINFEELEKLKFLKPKIFILCSPHNPVGRIWTNLELIKIGDFCIENNIILVVDEIHCDLTFPNKKFIPFASLNSKYLEKSIVLTSPTKTFNIAGIRGGNVLVFNEELQNILQKRFIRHGINKINVFYLAATISGYGCCHEWLKSLREYLYKNYLYVLNFMEKEIPDLLISPAEGTYLLWIEYKNLNISEEIFISELNKKLAVARGSQFGPGGIEHFRLNIATSNLVMEEAMHRLQETVIKLLKQKI